MQIPDVQVSFVKGEVVTGTVVQFEPTGALVDIGAKATAYMPAREVRGDSTHLVRKHRVYCQHAMFRH